MTIDDRRAGTALISRRSLSGMIVGGSAVGLLAAGPRAQAQSQAAATMNAEDHAGIERLIHRYAFALDNRDAAAFTDCFVPGLLTPAQVEKGIAFHRKFEYTVHNVLNHSYTVQGNTAFGSHYSLVTYVKNTGGKLTKFDTYARYENMKLIKQEGRWLFDKGSGGWKPIFSTAEVAVVKEVPAGFWEGLR